jgi:hypothetical protein
MAMAGGETDDGGIGMGADGQWADREVEGMRDLGERWALTMAALVVERRPSAAGVKRLTHRRRAMGWQPLRPDCTAAGQLVSARMDEAVHVIALDARTQP